jgi:hypothetical protein
VPATNPSNAFQPDSIAVDGRHVFVRFGDGVAKDGSDGTDCWTGAGIPRRHSDRSVG